MKIKILLWSVVSILIIGMAAGAFWWLERPQVVTFSDDSQVTLLKVDYGKHHVPPVVKASAPAPGTRAPVRRGGSFTTTNDTLVLWFRQEYDTSGNQYHGFQYYAYDKAGTACVIDSMTHYGNGGRRGNDVVGVEFAGFPRHQGKFYVRVEENGNGGQEIPDQKFAISNPVRGPFATWTPESLPATRDDDDVSVTLTKLVAGAPNTYNHNDSDADDAINKAVQATLHVERNGKAVSNWQPVSVTTSDATGNQVRFTSSNNNWQNGDDVFTYQYGLWPDEPAWKIRFEFSQQSDFADGELWTLQGIPLQPGRRQDFWNYNNRVARTNAAAVAETDLNGVHLKLLSPKQFTDASPNSNPQGGFFIQVEPPLPEGTRLTLVKLTDDQTNDIQHWDNTWNNNPNTTMYQCQMQDVIGATNINLTIAVHKSRFVEFTVKPEKAPASDSAQ